MSEKIKKILIVDDSESWRNYHLTVVKKLFPNAEFCLASSASEAYSKILEYNNTPFDIILTDMQMEPGYEPKYAGEWLIEKIKMLKNYYKTNILIISGTSNIKQIAELYNVDYIRKSLACNDISCYQDYFENLMIAV